MESIVAAVSTGIGIIAGLIIIYGLVLGFIDVVRSEFRKGEVQRVGFERIRYELGFHLLLGLEFLIAADIIRTILGPTLEELAVLGGIVAIRTVISYFLGKEIERHPIREEALAKRPDAPS